MVYLDYASHTPADEAVIEEFIRVERECRGNALSSHRAGQVARDELERATAGIAALLGVSPGEVIYTSGASESNNLAIKGLARAYAHKGRHILSTCLEHPSVSGALAYLGESGYEIQLLKILPDGTLDLKSLESALRTDTILLVISASDSELGAVQPIEAISQILECYPNCRLHIDAAQAMGKIPVDVSLADTLCFSPYKFYGLSGFGVLVKRQGVVLEPLIHGGSEKIGSSIYRGGTPSPANAAACYKALEIALREMDKRFEVVRGLRQYLLDKIKKCLQVRINSPEGNPYILNLSVKGIKGTDFQAALNRLGVAVSVKSACSIDNSPSRAVFAVTGDKKNALCSWRVSFSHLTTVEELDAFLSAFGEICAKGSY